MSKTPRQISKFASALKQVGNKVKHVAELAFQDEPTSPAEIARASSPEQPTQAEDVDKFFLFVHVIEARFVPVNEMADTFFVVLLRRNGSSTIIRRAQTDTQPQHFRVVYNNGFSVPVGASLLGAVDVTIEWWQRLRAENMLLGSRTFTFHKSMDDQWHPMRQGTDAVAVRMAISVSNSPDTNHTTTDTLKQMFASTDCHDKYGAVVSGRFRWEYAIQTSLHQWLEAHQKKTLEKFLATPIAQRNAQHLHAVLWRGVPGVNRQQFFLLLISKPFGEAGEYSTAMACPPSKRSQPPQSTPSSSTKTKFAPSAPPTPPKTLPNEQNVRNLMCELFGNDHIMHVDPAVVVRVVHAVHAFHPQLAHRECIPRIAMTLLCVVGEEASLRIIFRLCDLYLARLCSSPPTTTASNVQQEQDQFGGGGGGGLRVTALFHTTMHADQRLFRDVAATRLPVLMEHLAAHNYPICSVVMEWHWNLFCGVLPIDTCLRFFDVLLYDGPVVVHAVSVAVLKVLEQRLLAAKSVSAIHKVISEYAHNMFDGSHILNEAHTELSRWATSVPALHASYLQTLPLPKTARAACLRELILSATNDEDMKKLKSILRVAAQQTTQSVGPVQLQSLLPPMTDEISERIFSSFDVKFEGWINLQEFALSVSLMCHRTPLRTLEAFFNAFATKGSAQVTHDELELFLSTLSDLCGHVAELRPMTQPNSKFTFNQFVDAVRHVPMALCCMECLLLPLYADPPKTQPTSKPKTEEPAALQTQAQTQTTSRAQAHPQEPMSTNTANETAAAEETLQSVAADQSATPAHTTQFFEPDDTNGVSTPPESESLATPPHDPRSGSSQHSTNDDDIVVVSSVDGDSNTDGLLVTHDMGTTEESFAAPQALKDTQHDESQQQGAAETVSAEASTPAQATSTPTQVPVSEPVFVRVAELDKFEGWYECSLYDAFSKTDMHFVCIRQDGQGGCKWFNRAGACWGLTVCDDDPDSLAVGTDCPYQETTPRFRWEWGPDGKPLRVVGPWDEPYDFCGPLDAKMM